MNAWNTLHLLGQPDTPLAQVTAKMLQACYDPQEMDSFMANSLTPDELSKFTFNEFTYRVMSILTKQI